MNLIESVDMAVFSQEPLLATIKTSASAWPVLGGKGRQEMRMALLGGLALLLGSAASAETRFNAVRVQSGLLDLGGVAHPYVIEGKGEPCIVVGPATQYSQLLSDRLKQSLRFVFVDFKRSWNAPSGTDLSAITLQSL